MLLKEIESGDFESGGIRASGMWYRVSGWAVQDFSKDGSSYILEGEGKGSTILRSAKNFFTSYIVS
jgi:hypothetical protein